MSKSRAMRSRRRNRRRSGDAGHGDDERWLLTYADMITLLMALFMVLFSISSVNTAKFETLKEVLNNAFSPKVLNGGGSILPNGGAEKAPDPPSQVPVPAAIPPTNSLAGTNGTEEEDFRQLKEILDAYAADHGFSASIETVIDERGLVIRLLTDRVLFDSGSAVVKSGAYPLLAKISDLVNVDESHPISVEGNTDDLPIATGQYPSNWELSAARAASVARFMDTNGVHADRLEATGVADQRPIASNTNEAGRSRNRRVEIALLRADAAPEGGTSFR